MSGGRTQNPTNHEPTTGITLTDRNLQQAPVDLDYPLDRYVSDLVQSVCTGTGEACQRMVPKSLAEEIDKLLLEEEGQ
ncbi:hypothetical protein TWF281_010465 [Arthrobotrys megalospora]